MGRGELVTNGVEYTPGPILLDLEIDNEALKIAVWDSARRVPPLLAFQAAVLFVTRASAVRVRVSVRRRRSTRLRRR